MELVLLVVVVIVGWSVGRRIDQMFGLRERVEKRKEKDERRLP